MENKIQALTDKIYKEGVEKANEEAKTILEKTKNDCKAMTGSAQKEAQNILAAARKEAEELKKNTEAELKLYANQTVESLKTEITNLLNDQIAKKSVASATDDKTFMQQAILTIATEWVKNGNITIESAQASELKNFFASKANEILNKKIEIKEVNGKPASFTIIPEGDAYKVIFGEDEFVAFFKDVLRPQLADLLF